MIITANGKPRDVPDGSTIDAFLASLGWKRDHVVVEHNGEPLERARYGVTVLRAGDRLEVVRPVAGG